MEYNKMEFQVICLDDLVVAQFVFLSDAKRFIKAMDMPEGYHRIERVAKDENENHLSNTRW